MQDRPKKVVAVLVVIFNENAIEHIICVIALCVSADQALSVDKPPFR
jgi:hypothetical protein